jgi:hypothetical protein
VNINLEEEIWIDIDEYEGRYQVSNIGSVKSLKNNKGKYRELILKPKIDKDGYLEVNLCKQGKGVTKKVHRLVAQMFISNPNNLPEINHKDENPNNNKVDNLEWCTREYNNNYGHHNEKVIKSISNRVAQYDLDCNLIKIWNNTNEPKIEGFYQSAIYDCCTGKLKQYKGYLWRFYDREYKLNKEDYEELKTKVIYQYNEHLDLIKIWEKVKDIEQEGFDGSAIYKCLNDKKKIYKGYIRTYKKIINRGENQ